MPHAIQTSGITLLALLGVAVPSAAVADVTVQERSTLSVSSLNVHTTRTLQIAGDKERTESELRCEGMVSLPCSKNQQIDIVRLDRGVTWSWDPKKKRYTETPFLSVEQRRAAAERSRVVAEKLKSCPASPPAAVDISKCELSDPKASMEMTNEVAVFAGHEAKRTNLTRVQSCKTADPSQACEVAYAFEVWLAPEDIAGLGERYAFQQRAVTALGVGNDSGASSSQISAYLAPHAAAMKQLAETSEQLKGLPLKSTFRLTFSGQPCGATQTASAGSGRSSAIAGAGEAAGQATSSSAQHAASWGTADALERSTGSGVAGYVAGSAAGAFTGSLVSGLFAKKPKAAPLPAASNAPSSPSRPPATLLEFTLETTAVSVDPIAAAQFEPPSQFSKLNAPQNGDKDLPSCPSGARLGALR
jgi:hypothetical protein